MAEMTMADTKPETANGQAAEPRDAEPAPAEAAKTE